MTNTTETESNWAAAFTLSGFIDEAITRGWLPEGFTVKAPKHIGGGSYTFSTRDHVAPILADALHNGLQQKFADRVADRKAASQFPDAKALGDMFAERFAAGTWNEKGGGPRGDEKDKFFRQRATAIAEKRVRAAGVSPTDDDYGRQVTNERNAILKDEATIARFTAAWDALQADFADM